MSTVGLIGSGRVGQAIARRAIDAGNAVVLSNRRGAASLVALAAELGPNASAAAPDQAATADFVVVAIPFSAYPDLPAKQLAGQVVIDAGNYWAPRDGHVAAIDRGLITSSEVLAEQLPGALVVKAFNTIVASEIVQQATVAGTPRRRALPIAGDDGEAKKLVAAFMNEIGFDAVDAGPLRAGRHRLFDPLTAWQPPRTATDLRAALANG